MLVDCPRKLVVQLPRHEDHQDGSEPHDTGNDDQERLRLGPDHWADLVHVGQDRNRVLDLVDLDCAVDQETDVADTETNDLNRVFQPKRIVYQHQLIEETETVEGEEGRNRLR